MDGGMRSGGPSGVFVKNRNSSGCLIVRKKADGVSGVIGSSSTRGFIDLRNEKKRPNAAISDSESSDELVMPSRRRVGPETARACNVLVPYENGNVEDNGISRKGKRLERIRRDEDMICMRAFEGWERERKRGKLDVFGVYEYDGIDGDQVNMRRRHFDDRKAEFGERRLMGSTYVGRGGFDGEYESGPGSHMIDRRRHLYPDRESGLHFEDSVDRSRLKMNREGAQVPLPVLREQYMDRPDEAIRVQGKNGVLKVMVNKKKMSGGLPLDYNRFRAVESRQSLRTENSPGRNSNIHPSYPELKHVDRPGTVLRAEKNTLISKRLMSSKGSDEADQNSENSDTSLKLGLKVVHAQKSVKKKSHEDEPKLKNVQARKVVKKITSEDEQIPVQEKLVPGSMKEGKVKRGSGTEKQKLRERIRAMLLTAGWTIDYRPRKNRDYLDAVYINPSGTAYWSIIKAYEALQKQMNEDKEVVKLSADSGPSFPPISDEALKQLTRKTRKKLEKEMKKKKWSEGDSDSAKEAHHKHVMDGADSDSQEERLSSFLKQGNSLLKSKTNENDIGSSNSRSQIFSDELNDCEVKPSVGSDSHFLRGNRSKKNSRCALLVRGSNNPLNPETDDFVPYTGKLTILSWLIDSGTVKLSEKVLYCRRKRVMLEGWITRDGIHCGCCSKILTVSKFEIHAGSKLRQPFQNIYLESGISLFQCQIDAWNRQENLEKIRFHSVDVDGDDPNDDTCGLCGDGGDLICCDSCPSTFHQNCLGMEVLPLGEWHCPNCTCRFCGLTRGNDNQNDNVSILHTCHLCEKKYHESCIKEMYSLSVDSNSSDPGFCGKDCKELFEHLKKYLGTKHELDAGYSWSLIRKCDEDSDASFRGIYQRVESNSKLAVALSVMDECFLPIVDRRSGINLIRNVLYNSGSNFYRLSYSGFYTAVLERGDEIISAASIRFHGPKLAEMPFIGTRQMYRHQGMCRRLLSALDLALCSLKVEKLIIPAVLELMHTWSASFGFTPLEKSLKKDMRSMNVLVFPGVDMLEKRLNAEEKLEGSAPSSGHNHLVRSDALSKSDIESPSGQDAHGCDEDSSQPSNERTGEGAASDFSQSEGVVANAASISSGSLSGAHKSQNPDTADATLHYGSGEMLVDSSSGKQCVSAPKSGHVAVEKAKLVAVSPVKDNDLHFSPQHHVASLNNTAMNLSDDLEASIFHKKTASPKQKIVESDSDCKTQSASFSKDDSLDTGSVRNSDSQVGACPEPNNEDTGNTLEVGAVPFSGHISSDNITKFVDEEPKGCTVRGGDETPVHMGSDLNVAVSEDAIRLHDDDSETTSSETHYEENIDHASPGDRDGTDTF